MLWTTTSQRLGRLPGAAKAQAALDEAREHEAKASAIEAERAAVEKYGVLEIECRGPR